MRKYPNDVKIKAYTLYAVLGSVRGVAEELKGKFHFTSSDMRGISPKITHSSGAS